MLVSTGISDYFKALVLSCSLGVCKPHPLFDTTVLEVAGCPTERGVFVGDTPNKDGFGSIAYGMQAVLVAADAIRPDCFPNHIPVIVHGRALSALLLLTKEN